MVSSNKLKFKWKLNDRNAEKRLPSRKNYQKYKENETNIMTLSSMIIIKKIEKKLWLLKKINFSETVYKREDGR